MNKKFFVPLTLTSLLLATFGATALPTQSIQAHKADESRMHTFHQIVHTQSDAKNILQELPETEAVKNHYQNYTVTDTQTDDLGFTHYTLKPEIQGKVATDKEIKVHVNTEGNVVFVNGETNAKEVNPTNTVQRSKEAAIDDALNALHINKDEAHNIDQNIIQKADVEIDGNLNKFIYLIEITTTTPEMSHWKVKVDAQTGEVLSTQNLMLHAATTGTGTGVLGDTKNININSITGGFSLEDLTHQGKIAAYHYDGATDRSDLVTNPNTNFNAQEQRAGVDANYYAGIVYDYYKNTHGRESYDGKGSPVLSYTHVNGGNMNNAAWLGDKMIYSDGDGVTFTALSGAKDVVAHEITHGVTQTSANLEYYAQPGALNESFSDVFGYFVDNDDWLIGEDVYTPGIPGDALRSMSEPAKYGQPEHMRDYVFTTGDNAGVHINSGIPNKAAYNIITKIGQAKAEKIYYRALTKYLTTTSDFKAAKEALFQAADDLYGLTTANEVWYAWDAVGVK